MKRNYQLELDRITASLSGRPRLLLHSCCGPCSSYVLEYLTRYFEVFLSYYNPNIQPREEYDLRLENQLCVLGRMPGVTLVPCGYDGGAYDEAVRGLEDEPEGGARCTECFKLRLDFAAREAKRLGCDYFATTLTVSPHKDAQRINAIGEALAGKYGVKWLPGDFKKRDGYKRSIELSREFGLYRQDYCGCLYSKTER
ncbi:MAG TPA: epoxyqueuosine reductase QueH [Candidatus Scatomorpha stercoravium]|nr:epoxyqueuosine reductase QueH [Candidatus Scatomorpha stercoravium]